MRDARLDVMYRYVEEYTNRHDLAVARQIMHPDYRFTMGDRTLDLESYLSMVDGALDHFTDLRLVVDEFIIGPQRLAMAFTESATSPRHQRSASWPGIALYEFHADGRLLAARVQQDFWGRRLQFKGETSTAPPGTTDPAVWDTSPGEAHPDTLAATQQALQRITSAAAYFDGGAPLVVNPNRVDVDDVVVSGNRFAAAITLTGEAVDSPDEVAFLGATGVGSISHNGTITEGRFVTDRWGLWTKRRSKSSGL